MPASMMTAEIYSEALGRPTKICALLPPSLVDGRREAGYLYKTVYLLPGALGGSEVLFSETDLASAYDGSTPEDVIIISVTPTFSYYTDYHSDYQYAHKYYTYITQELPEMTRTLFPLSHRREDTAIYGFSMGGYGAFLCGLNHPEIYGYVGAQSGMLDAQDAIDNRPFMTIKHRRQYGPHRDITGTMYDLYDLTKRLDEKAASAPDQVPKIFQSWGGEKDYLNIPNVHMHQHMQGMKHLDYTCYQLDNIHSWGKHNEGVYLFLDWFLHGDQGGAQ